MTSTATTTRRRRWGNRQKLPIGPNLLFELRRAERGDGAARERARFTFGKQRALLDPVWGGYYQYSAASTWDAPHFEKRLVMQSENLQALARGASVLGDASLLADARSVGRYMIEFLGDAAGAFHPNQDADVGAHDRAGRFVDGHDFYRLDDAGRRAVGRPWVDPHVYARESAMAARALCALHEATAGQGTDAAWLARARRAVDVLLARFVIADGGPGGDGGGVLHDAETPRGPRFLVDAAELGHVLVRLHAIGHEPGYRDAALRIATAIARDFGAPPATGAALFDVTIIDGASGAFGLRARSFAPNVAAARFFTALARVTGEPRHRERARQLLAAIATPGAIDDQGRLLGDFPARAR